MPALRRSLASLILGAPLALLLQVPSAWGQPSQASEYELKAAFLFHFLQFVEWPQHSGASICVGVYGDDPFGPALDRMVRGETVQGRSLVIRRADQIQSLHDCEVVFIGRSQKTKVAEFLEALHDASTLTIGEVEGFEGVPTGLHGPVGLCTRPGNRAASLARRGAQDRSKRCGGSHEGGQDTAPHRAVNRCVPPERRVARSDLRSANPGRDRCAALGFARDRRRAA